IAIVLENAKLYQSLNQAFHQIERANKKIEAYSLALSRELEKGRYMQRTFLPEKMPRIPGWQIDACFHPAKQVSGDFYDLFPIGEGHLGIVLADVCDKGVSAALFMGIFRSLIHVYLEKAFQEENRSPVPGGVAYKTQALADQSSRALLLLNDYIERHHGKEGIFATLFFGILHTRDGRLKYINAGHEPLMIVDGRQQTRDLIPTGPAIGIMMGARFDVASVRLAKAETLIGFTDGITEAFSPRGADFGRSGIYQAIARHGASGAKLMGAILEEVFDHLEGSELTDDIAMISIERTD
ncbi:MAG: PP2C family protein-serine/threonine phosphatase, partial [Desulfobacterales bacterium]